MPCIPDKTWAKPEPVGEADKIWLYHKFDGIDGNGKETDFTPEELETLKAAFRDLARRLCEAADNL